MSGGERIDRLRLLGAAGTNKVMAGELSRLARRAFSDVRLPEPIKEGQGAIVYPFDTRVAWLAANYHRTSARVLWDLVRSDAQRLEPLYDDVFRAVAEDPRPWLEAAATLSVQAFNVGAFAAGERQIVGTVKNAVLDAARSRGVELSVQPTSPDRWLSVRLFEGRTIVSLDLAGRPMHQRGYRRATAEAPLREDLAATLVMLARFDARSEILLDPMAGSGTLAIEATCMADARPLWVGRTPACAHLPPLAPLGAANQPLFADTQAAVLVNDCDPSALQACRDNAERAGATASLRVRQGDFRALSRAVVETECAALGRSGERGLILSNPPYGERLSPGDLGELYAGLGVWTRQFVGWRAAFMVANPDFERAFGRRPRIKKPLSNGPLRGYFYLYEL